MARGRIRDEDLEALRDQSDIVDIISDYVQLKKAGRLYKGLCPFHDEKTPSFMVDPSKQLYHCFGCSEGGNIFSFLKKKEGLEFREAAERLAARTGFTLRYEGVSKEASEVEDRRARLYRINQWAADVYSVVLTKDAGKVARDYLTSRDFDDEIIRLFHLGFAPASYDFLYRQAMRKGIGASDFVGVGLGIKGERGIYDRFRGRLIFPIRDLQDRVIAFGGRVIGEGQPKYLNSPETALYVKSKHLYNLNLARREIVSSGYAILVEGYTDVIGLWQAGIRNVAATLGTALSEEHFRLLSRLTERVVFAFDADAAGVSASERGLDFYDQFNLDLRVMVMEKGLDPADFVASQGKDGFLQKVESSLPLIDFCLEQLLREHDASDANARLRAVRKGSQLLGTLDSDIEHERYIKRMADWAGSNYDTVHDIYQQSRVPGKSAKSNLAESNIAMPPQIKVERELLRLVVHHLYLLERLRDELDTGLFIDQVNRSILQALLEVQPDGDSLKNGGRTISRLIEKMESEQVRNFLAGLIFDKSGNVDNIDRDGVDSIYVDLLTSLKEFYFERQIRRLKKDLEGLSSTPQRDHKREGEVTEEICALERLKRELR
ncbi:MAG: DNA primase [Candidatus Solincola sediminis]|uniref:DNA primase n=1 Tax=Candidatus Solincola sediminis TaxID=1797199 RepID=A0A1F2WFE2_9ACTN|nr:MAG: DNA primase [Candidatus Solincola sediminis]OFW57753.1 MAG: DNA primase [Candidatus Solincola sediminis]